jgi:hypothetical protein
MVAGVAKRAIGWVSFDCRGSVLCFVLCFVLWALNNTTRHTAAQRIMISLTSLIAPQAKQIANEQAYQRVREATFRELSESLFFILFFVLYFLIPAPGFTHWRLSFLGNRHERARAVVVNRPGNGACAHGFLATAPSQVFFRSQEAGLRILSTQLFILLDQTCCHDLFKPIFTV